MSFNYPTWGMNWGVSWGESWGPIEVEESPAFGPWCVGGSDTETEQPKHVYGQHPFFRPVDLPKEVNSVIDEIVVEQTQVSIKKQQADKTTDEYWALHAYEQMLRIEAERLTDQAITNARKVKEQDVAFVVMMLMEG